MPRSLSLVALLLAVNFNCPLHAQNKYKYEIHGRIVDAKGKPAANIEVGTSWNFTKDSQSPRWRSDVVARPGTSLKSDDEGKFSGTLYARRPTVAIVALDRKTKQGALFILSREMMNKEFTLKLEPLIHLHGKISTGEAKVKNATYYLYLSDPRARIAFASFISKERQFSLLVPPGVYQLSFSAADLQKVTLDVMLKKEHRELDLGNVELSLTNLARHYGKKPPAWNITAARGVKKDVKLADYKGKWVMIEFWAYW